MNPIGLKSGGYDGTYKLVAGEISLDFVNTISWPDTPQEHEWLDRTENVIDWARATGIINENAQSNLDAKSTREDLNRVRDIRSSLSKVLRPLAYDEQPTPSAIKELNKLNHQATNHRNIDPSNHQWIWKEPKTLTEILNPVIWNATHVLTNVDHTRIRHCPSCNWIFYDTTRNRSRKWCDMGDCGSRDKALRYYHRTKSVEGS